MSAVGAGAGSGAADAGRPYPHSAGGTREFGRNRNTSYRIYLLLAVVGLVLVLWMLVNAGLRSPITLAYAAVWAAWGLLAYAIVTRADLNWSVPGTVRFAAVAWGVLCLPISGQLVGWVSGAVPVGEQWSAAVHAPLPEEATKLLGVVLIAYVVPAVFARPLGALTVGMLTGLGFTTLQNFEQANREIAAGESPPAVLLAHGVYQAPWAHLTFTGIAALGVWCVVAFRNRPVGARLVVASAFFLLAVLMHFLRDAIGPVLGGELPVLGYWAVLLLVLLALVVWARRMDRSWFRALTAGGLPPVLEVEEAASLRTRRGRRRARRVGATREVQKTQLRYANAVSDGDDSMAEDMLHRERLLRIAGEDLPA